MGTRGERIQTLGARSARVKLQCGRRLAAGQAARGLFDAGAPGRYPIPVSPGPSSSEDAIQNGVAWIVDDSPLESEMARRALSPGYQVQVFNDGSAALERLAAGRAPDVLVLDWVMPGLSGIEICEFVRSRPATAELAVLLLTMNQQTEQIVEGLRAGANDYLIKPYAAPELRARVDALVRSKRMRERAEHAETLLKKVLSQLPDAVVTIDGKGGIVFVNARAEEVFGEKREQLAGRRLTEMVPNLVLDRMIVATPRQAVLPDVEIRGQVYFPCVSIPPSDDEGNTTITLRDVTALRLKEKRQVDFYSMVAHDLRSPLNALHMRAQMLLQGLRGALSAEVRQEVEKMSARGRDLVQMVNDFLAIAQMETAQFHIEHVEVDVAQVCARIYDEYRPLANSRGLQLSMSADQAEARVQGDPRRISQVVENLVANALKFTGSDGKVAIRVSGDAGMVEVTVEDTGHGIPPEAQQRLFTKYARVEGSAAKVEGTGLGLVIVKEIVEAHGGTVGVRSQPGAGTVFWFRLPRASAAR